MYIYTVRVLYTPSPPQMCFYIVYHLESFRGHKKPKAKISPRSQWVVSHPRVGDVVVHCVKSFQRMMGLSFPPLLSALLRRLRHQSHRRRKS